MSTTLKPNPARSVTGASAAGLRWWLVLVTITAVVLALLAVIFGLLINMDTRIEMNPNGDPLVRQDAIEYRAFAWAAVAIFILLLAFVTRAWWRAFQARRGRLALGLSLIVAVPACLLVGTLAAATLSEL